MGSLGWSLGSGESWSVSPRSLRGMSGVVDCPWRRSTSSGRALVELTPYHPLQPVRKLLPSSEPQTSKVVSRAVVDLGGTDQPCPRSVS